MLSKIILSASAVAMLFTAQAIAQDTKKPIIKPPAGQQGEQAPQMKQQDMGTTQGQSGQAADTQTTKRKLQSPDTAQDTQENMNAQPDQSTAQGEEGTTKRKPRAGEQAQQGDQDQTKTRKRAQQQTQEGQQKTDQTQQAEEGTTTTKKRTQQKQSDEMTTGSTSKAVDITPEKRTIIRERIITRNVTRIERDDIDIDLNIGVVVPSTISLLPLPTTVVEVVPEYEGYLYFVLADGTIIIVEPGSMQIVYVMTA